VSLLISAFWVARIIGVSLRHLPDPVFFTLNPSCMNFSGSSLEISVYKLRSGTSLVLSSYSYIWHMKHFSSEARKIVGFFLSNTVRDRSNKENTRF
jgi:hypothetical protein